jgi:hypothetical protein
MKRLCMLWCLAVGVVASGCSAASTAESAGSSSGAISSVAVAVAVTSMRVTAASRTGVNTSASPSPSPTCSGFALSLASDRGGQSSPINAAVWFAQHGSVQGIPKTGWKEVSTGKAEATVHSEGLQLHVIEGPDQTWQVDSGQYYCP